MLQKVLETIPTCLFFYHIMYSKFNLDREWFQNKTEVSMSVQMWQGESRSLLSLLVDGL